MLHDWRNVYKPCIPLCIEDMELPGFRLHPLKGDRKKQWAVSVSGNWRVVFEFKNGDAYVVNYEDYH
jgi:proteic killer suppression protein